MLLEMNTVTESKNPLEIVSQKKIKFGPKMDEYEVNLLGKNKMD